MEFRQLQYMLMVADERSFSKAAQKLFIAQPSLSQYIGKLEQQLGIQLFNRSSKTPLTLTFAGELFAENARRILDMRRKLQIQMDEVIGCKQGRITIGISVARSKLILPKILPVFSEKFPGIQVNPVEGTLAELEDFAMKGVTDFSIVTLPINSPQFIIEPLYTEEYMLLLPANHRLSKNTRNCPPWPKIRLSDVLGDSFILLPPGRGLRAIADQLFAKAGIQPRIILESKNIETLFALVAAGVGITLFTDVLQTLSIPFEFSQQVTYFALENPPPPKILAIAYREDRYQSQATREFISCIKEIFTVQKDAATL